MQSTTFDNISFSAGTTLYELLLFSDPFASQESESDTVDRSIDSLGRSLTPQIPQISGTDRFGFSPERAGRATTDSTSDAASGVETIETAPQTNLLPNERFTGVPGESQLLTDTGWQYIYPESLDRPVTQNVEEVREFGPFDQTDVSTVTTQAKAEEAIGRSEGTVGSKRELSVLVILSAIAFMSVIGYLIYRRRLYQKRR